MKTFTKENIYILNPENSPVTPIEKELSEKVWSKYTKEQNLTHKQIQHLDKEEFHKHFIFIFRLLVHKNSIRKGFNHQVMFFRKKEWYNKNEIRQDFNIPDWMTYTHTIRALDAIHITYIGEQIKGNIYLDEKGNHKNVTSISKAKQSKGNMTTIHLLPESKWLLNKDLPKLNEKSSIIRYVDNELKSQIKKAKSIEEMQEIQNKMFTEFSGSEENTKFMTWVNHNLRNKGGYSFKNKTIEYKQIHNEDEEHGGRWYSPFQQQEDWQRKQILGNKFIEFDFPSFMTTTAIMIQTGKKPEERIHTTVRQKLKINKVWDQVVKDFVNIYFSGTKESKSAARKVLVNNGVYFPKSLEKYTTKAELSELINNFTHDKFDSFINMIHVRLLDKVSLNQKNYKHVITRYKNQISGLSDNLDDYFNKKGYTAESLYIHIKMLQLKKTVKHICNSFYFNHKIKDFTIKHIFINFEEIEQAYQTTIPEITFLSNQKRTLKMMKIESEILKQVFIKCISNGIIIYSVHDAFYVPKEYYNWFIGQVEFIRQMVIYESFHKSLNNIKINPVYGLIKYRVQSSISIIDQVYNEYLNFYDIDGKWSIEEVLEVLYNKIIDSEIMDKVA